MTTIILLPVDTPAPIGPACAGTQRVTPTFLASQTANESWNGTAWDLFQGAGPSHRWGIVGTWNLGYRPTSIDFTYTPGVLGAFDFWEFKVYDVVGNLIGNVGGAFQGNTPGVQTTINCPLTFVEPNDLGDGGPNAPPEMIEFQGDAYGSISTLDGVCFLPS